MQAAAVIVILLMAVLLGTGAQAEVGSDEPISFLRTVISPDWKEADGFNASFDHLLIEDGQGIVHFFYNDYSMNVYHQVLGADGAWSAPEPAASVSLNSGGYRAGVAPDGTLCFVWMEDERFQNGDIQDLTNVLHVKRYRDAAWQQGEEVLDYRDIDGGAGAFAGFQIALDALGKLHTLYVTFGCYGRPETRGMYLDGRMVMRYDDRGLTSEALVPQIGKMESVRFFIDSRNVFHLIGMDTDSLIPDSYPYGFTRCVHSFSLDGGKTWKGPFAVLDSKNAIGQLAIAEDSTGVLHIMANRFVTDQPELLTVTLRPDDYIINDVQGYFNEAQMQKDLAGQPWEEVMKYLGLSFRWLFVDSAGTDHYFADSMYNETLEFTLTGGNNWTVRVFEMPEDTVLIKSILPRRNGNLLFEAVQNGGMEPKMYFAEVSAQD
jgi:hypothetical protein